MAVEEIALGEMVVDGRRGAYGVEAEVVVFAGRGRHKVDAGEGHLHVISNGVMRLEVARGRGWAGEERERRDMGGWRTCRFGFELDVGVAVEAGEQARVRRGRGKRRGVARLVVVAVVRRCRRSGGGGGGGCGWEGKRMQEQGVGSGF